MTDQERLAKLYEVKGLPFPLLITERMYWLKRVVRFGIHPTAEEFDNWFEGIKRDDNLYPTR